MPVPSESLPELTTGCGTAEVFTAEVDILREPNPNPNPNSKTGCGTAEVDILREPTLEDSLWLSDLMALGWRFHRGYRT